MEYYTYRDWMLWPEADIREYAREIADDQSLTQHEADYLESQMAERAGHWPSSPCREVYSYPQKMDAEAECLFRSLSDEEQDEAGTPSLRALFRTRPGDDDANVFEENRWRNAPYHFQSAKYQIQSRSETIGGGLTQRRISKIVNESRQFARRRRNIRRKTAIRPFSSMNHELEELSDRAMWEADCYPVNSRGAWLITGGNQDPYDGLVWYARQLLRTYYNARHQSGLGNSEAALWHAFRAGSLRMELEMRLAHGETFEKYQAVNFAQRQSAQSRKTVPDEVRREAYWRFRNEGNKRIEAGRLAASELGLSEASIRAAFPNGKYPPE